jgi:hypothetical protein
MCWLQFPVTEGYSYSSVPSAGDLDFHDKPKNFVSVVFELAGPWRGWNMPVSPTYVSVVFELAGPWRGWNMPVSPTCVSVVFNLEFRRLETVDLLEFKNTNSRYAAVAWSFSLEILWAAHRGFGTWTQVIWLIRPMLAGNVLWGKCRLMVQLVVPSYSLSNDIWNKVLFSFRLASRIVFQ